MRAAGRAGLSSGGLPEMTASILYKLRNRYQLHVGGWTSRRWGGLSRAIRFPIPGTAPWQRRHLEVAREAGIGDILMCTPALREVKRRNPSGRITFYAGFPDVLCGLPFVDEVRPFTERPRHALLLAVEGSYPPARHLAHVFADNLGVTIDDVRPGVALDPARAETWRARFASRPRPLIVVNRYSSTLTPNKDWADACWVELIDRMCRAGMSVVETGHPNPATAGVPRGGYEDLRGRTTLADVSAILAAADAHVGPSSGPHHMAAAVGTPAVVIYGGFEHPVGTAYPGNVDLYTQLPCSPCWLTTPCPIGKECLKRITPAAVFAAIQGLVERRDARIPLTPQVRRGVE
jgi:ADP-heptose:LPS heptosyltransferase